MRVDWTTSPETGLSYPAPAPPPPAIKGSCPDVRDRPRNYAGGTIRYADRAIENGEEVVVNADGRVGIVDGRQEGEHVFLYAVRFDNDPSERWFKPTEITPLTDADAAIRPLAKALRLAKGYDE